MRINSIPETKRKLEEEEDRKGDHLIGRSCFMPRYLILIDRGMKPLLREKVVSKVPCSSEFKKAERTGPVIHI
jgi:hypothetical protein